MTVKTNGAELKSFYADAKFWPKDAYQDDEEITVDGDIWTWEFDLTTIDDMAVVTIAGGTVYMDTEVRDGPSLEAFFRKWKKAQNTEFFMCEVPKNLADAVRAAIIAAGGRVR